MKKADTFRDFVSEQLGEGVTVRAMFGGYGLSRDDAFFGIVFKGRLYFRTSPKTRKDYLDLGMKPFKPKARMTLKTYFEVPADVLENRETLREWADKAARRSPE
jgi:DNA transformation protein